MSGYEVVLEPRTCDPMIRRAFLTTAAGLAYPALAYPYVGFSAASLKSVQRASVTGGHGAHFTRWTMSVLIKVLM